MSKKTRKPTKVIVTGRLSYAFLFDRPTNPDGTEGKFRTSLLIPKSDTETVEIVKGAIQEAIKEGVSDRWGGKKPSKIATTFYDGDEEKPDDEDYAGHYYLNVNSDSKPTVVGKYRDPETGKALELGPDEVYSGCWANVSVTFKAYSHAGKNGISAFLGNVQKHKDDARFDGRTNVEDEFEFEEVEEDDIFG